MSNLGRWGAVLGLTVALTACDGEVEGPDAQALDGGVVDAMVVDSDAIDQLVDAGRGGQDGDVERERYEHGVLDERFGVNDLDVLPALSDGGAGFVDVDPDGGWYNNLRPDSSVDAGVDSGVDASIDQGTE